MGRAIIRKLKLWKTASLVAIKYETHTHRCNQAIADFGDSFFPNEPRMVSNNDVVTDHDGVFLVASAYVNEYVRRLSPQVLRYNVKTSCGSHALNFG